MTCSIASCERPKGRARRGWCEAHYARWRRTGAPEIPVRACHMCNVAFIPKRTDARCCSRKCTLRAANLRLNYGLAGEAFHAMLLEQRNRCQVCKGRWGDRGPVVDHCHDSGRVRSLLCDGCNVALGMIRESERTAINLAVYIAHHREVTNEQARLRRVLRSQGDAAAA